MESAAVICVIWLPPLRPAPAPCSAAGVHRSRYVVLWARPATYESSGHKRAGVLFPGQGALSPVVR